LLGDLSRPQFSEPKFKTRVQKSEAGQAMFSAVPPVDQTKFDRFKPAA
jgi:hypothetical protein